MYMDICAAIYRIKSVNGGPIVYRRQNDNDDSDDVNDDDRLDDEMVCTLL